MARIGRTKNRVDGDFTKYSIDFPIKEKKKLQKRLKELSIQEEKYYWEIIYSRVMEG